MNRFLIISVGKPREGADGVGGDKRLAAIGFPVELVESKSEDGGPACIAACPDVATAARIKNALELIDRL